MEKLAIYQDIIKRILHEYAQWKPTYGDIEVETIFDDAQGHYEILYMGWEDRRRVHGTVLHVDIRNGKVWVQFDGTENGITEELVASGIPREHIVLGFHSPYKRRFTPYAVQ
jgi:ketopantoate reductase